MMPIFFHVEAHIWILYALFGNGFLLNIVLRRFSKSYACVTEPIEAQVICAFVFSLLTNYAVLYLLEVANARFSLSLYLLLSITVVLTFVVLGWCKGRLISLQGISFWAISLYGAVFVMLFLNGGLIDQVSDAWWHMSKANRIGWENSILNHSRHLTGVEERYYPSLWHANLAMLRDLSGVGLPSIWNAFTAWGAVLKTMGFYLLGYGLFKNRTLALLSAALFVLLPGVGSSYLRVSAWPSHLSYVVLFAALYVFFDIFKKLESLTGIESIREVLANPAHYFILACYLISIYLLHAFELVLFFSVIFAFLISRSLSMGLFNGKVGFDKNDKIGVISMTYRGILIALLVVSLWLVLNSKSSMSLDNIYKWFPFIVFLILTLVEFRRPEQRSTSIILGVSLVFLVLLSLDYQHIYSLFDRTYALPLTGTHERPLASNGWFGEQLYLPSWDFELRQGLLWSGVVGLILSIWMHMTIPSNGSMFLTSTSILVWIVCTSPYVYTWISATLDYHSVWRLSITSFHPLIIGASLLYLFDKAALRGSNENTD